MKTNVDFLKDRLIDLFGRDESFVISIDGEWGVGKTRFWNNFKDEYLKDKKVSYVSLFGKDNIESIRMDIIFQISKKDEYISKSKGFFSNLKSSIGLKDEDVNLGLTGSVLSSLLTLFSKKDFENVVVCLDDFERLSKNLDEKDILGLISELKEQKNCQVVMILNEGEVEDDTLSKYKDKIIDYELHYSPTTQESYSLVEDKLLCFKDYPLKYFLKQEINNIRVMKRVVNSLNDFHFVEELVKEHKSLEREIVENIIELSTINSLTTFKEFDKLSDYTLDKRRTKSSSYGNEKSQLINEKYEEVLSYIEIGTSEYFHMTDVTNFVVEYIQSSIVDNDKLISLINEKKKVHNREFIYSEVHRLYEQFSFSIEYKVDDFVKELYSLFEKNSKNIIGIISSGNFIFYINLLKELDSGNQDKYHKLGVDVLKIHIDEYIDRTDKINMFERNNFIEVQKFDKSFEEYILEQSKLKKETKISNIDEVIKMMRRPIEERIWGDEPDLLSLINEETLKEYVLESQKFVKSSFDLIRKFGISTNSSFGVFIGKLINVFEQLKCTDNKDYQVKMTKLLNFFDRK